MFYILRRSMPDAIGAAVEETVPAGTELQAPAVAPREEQEIRQSRLFYVRRYGPIMGMCLYQLDSSLRASGSGGSECGVTAPPDGPCMKGSNPSRGF